MSSANQITNSGAYQRCLDAMGITPSRMLDNCLESGLPAVWLYMKAIGLQAEYFLLLNTVKDRSFRFKELLYLLLLTSSQGKFFPKVPSDLLKIKITPDVLAAQVEIAKPDFELCYTFSADQLKTTLEELATPGRMIQIGNKQCSIGLMYKDNIYSTYHTGNDNVTEYNSIEKCVAAIERLFSEPNSALPVLFIQGSGLQNMPLAPAPDALKLFKSLCDRATALQLQATVYMSVQAGLLDQVKYLEQLDVDFNHLYVGNIDLLTLAVSQPIANLQLVNFLLTKINPTRAREHLQVLSVNHDSQSLQALLRALTGNPMVFTPAGEFVVGAGTKKVS